MAEKEQIKQKPKKSVKKKFYEVSAPLTSAKIHLYASSEEELEGKTIKLDLTKSLRGKSLELKFRIKNDAGKLRCLPEQIELTMSYIQKVMRKSADYCEDSFKAECRDASVLLKPLLITRKRVSRAVLKSLRNNTKEFLTTYLKTRTAEEIFQEIITNKLQKQLSLKLKKIYPLALCEIRVFQVLKYKEESKK